MLGRLKRWWRESGSNIGQRPVCPPPVSGPVTVHPHVAHVDDGLRLTWAEWQALRAMIDAPPGWLTGRFAARSVHADAPGETVATWPYGIMRGHFGVYERDFATSGSLPLPITLACLIHLDTGMGCGLFAAPDLAVEAAVLAQTVPAIDWSITDPDKVIPGQLSHKLEAAWAAVGIGRANFCVVDTADGAGPLIVFARLATHAAHLPKERLS